MRRMTRTRPLRKGRAAMSLMVPGTLLYSGHREEA
jgi:hypothetical protein